MSKTLNAVNQEIAEYINEWKMNMLIQLNELSTSPTAEDIERLQQFVCNYKVLSIVDKSNVILMSEDPHHHHHPHSYSQQKRPRRKKSEVEQMRVNLNIPHVKNGHKLFYIRSINGIQYYVDEKENVYQTESILDEHAKPRILCKMADL